MFESGPWVFFWGNTPLASGGGGGGNKYWPISKILNGKSKLRVNAEEKVKKTKEKFKLAG